MKELMEERKEKESFEEKKILFSGQHLELLIILFSILRTLSRKI
jgi:hypothetical protein